MYFLDEGELAINMKSNQNSITYPLKPPFFLEAAKLPPADALSVVAFESGRQKEKKMKHSHLKKVVQAQKIALTKSILSAPQLWLHTLVAPKTQLFH